MFISASILVICMAAMIQFAVFSWRAGLLRTIATEPAGDQAELAAEISRNLLNGKDFADISSLQGLCPDLKNGRVNLRTGAGVLQLPEGYEPAGRFDRGARREWIWRLDEPRDGFVCAIHGCGVVAAIAEQPRVRG